MMSARGGGDDKVQDLDYVDPSAEVDPKAKFLSRSGRFKQTR